MERDIGTLSERDFAHRAAYLQQRVEMTFDYTARDVVLSGRYPYLAWWQQEKDTDMEIAAACMAYTGVSELADKPLHVGRTAPACAARQGARAADADALS